MAATRRELGKERLLGEFSGWAGAGGIAAGKRESGPLREQATARSGFHGFAREGKKKGRSKYRVSPLRLRLRSR